MSRKEVFSEIEDWLSERPYWVQYIAKFVLEGEECDEKIIDNAYQYFLEDKELTDDTIERDSIQYSGAESTEEDSYTDLQLSMIKDVESVNALSKGQRIDFGEQLTVIYGKNGSGKTGYVRIMNNAFHARGDTKILQNVSQSGKSNGIDQPSCTFEFNNSGDTISLDYPEKENNDLFKCFSVFDNKCVKIHLGEENKFSFSPSGFEFFDGFIDAFNKVIRRLNNEIENRTKGNEFLVHFEKDTEIKTYIEELNANSDPEKLEQYADFSEKNEGELAELKKQYDKLKVTDFSKSIGSLNKKKQSLEILKTKFSNLVSLLNDQSIENYKQLIKKYSDCSEVLKKEGSERFESNEFHGIGSDSWKEFISTAKKFADIQQKHDKERAPYPVEDDSCIFCRQSLSENEIALINEYWDYLDSTAELNFKKANESIEFQIDAIEKKEIPNISEDTTIGSWLQSKNENRYKKLTGVTKQIEDNLNLVKENLSSKEWKNEIESFESIEKLIDENLAEITKEIDDLNEQKKKYDEDIKRLESEKTFLEQKKTVKKLYQSIKDYITNSKWVADAKYFKPTSRFITTFQKSLFSQHITEKYEAIFNTECDDLLVPFKVDIKQRGETGTTLRKLKIVEYSPDDVLSEGEQRAVSLADFLTEIQLDKDNFGIIFDDPVNSLDHERKELIAERLVRESKSRQVIIFTHDLVFLYKLNKACDDNDIEIMTHWMERADDQVGNVFLNNSPSLEKDYQKTSKAQKFYETAKDAEPKEQEHLIQQGFGALRTTYETFIIFKLLGRVVQRWDEVISVGRLRDVVITDEIIDEVIERYETISRYIEGHSHSDKFSESPPTPKMLIKEIEKFNSLKKRQKEIYNEHKNAG